jgi:hypothetical protein
MTDLNRQRIIALDVRPRSFAFVIFEGPREILDWGARSFRGGVNKVRVPCGLKIMRLIDQYVPDALVLQRPRNKAREQMVEEIRRQARTQKIPVWLLLREEVAIAFAGRNGNKQEIAAAIYEQFPEFLSILPPPRRSWESEDYRMSIFDAAATGIAYFRENSPAAPSPPK